MIKILTFVLCLTTLNAFSQNHGWNKEEKNGTYLDCISAIEKYEIEKMTSKENLCLCYLEKIKDKYSFNEYDNKIDIEKRRLKDNNIKNCASELDISLLKESSAFEISQPNMKPKKDQYNIIGVWSFEKGTFSFYQDNEYKYESKRGKCRGTWSIKGDFLDIDSKFCSDEKFEIVKAANDEIIMYRIRGRKLFHLKRQL